VGFVYFLSSKTQLSTHAAIIVGHHVVKHVAHGPAIFLWGPRGGDW